MLGACGAALGVAAGFLIAVAGRPLWERLEDGRILSWEFGPWEIAAAALIGLLSGLAAAVIPAIGAARMRPVDALAERFRTSRSARRRTTLVGIALVAAGVLLALIGDRQLADDFAAYARDLEAAAGTSAPVSMPTPARPVAAIMGGALLLVAGLVVLTPTVIAGLASPAARMPLSLRLAMRDAARHRHRTGPATSAIAVAVAGSVALAFLLVGNLRADELQHVPALPPHVLTVELGETDVSGMTNAAEQAAAELPDASAHVQREPLRALAEGESVPSTSEPYLRQLFLTPRPAGCLTECVSGSPAIAGTRAFNALAAGRPLHADERAALADGKAIVFDPELYWPGARIAVETQTAAGELRNVHVPAVLVRRDAVYTSLPVALLPERVAREHGWDIEPMRAFVSFGDGATRDEVDSALAAADRFGAFAGVEDGPDDPGSVGLLILAGVAAFVTFVGVAISVALSAAEGRADLATLAAVGAPPRRRRGLAAAQALLVAGVGCALGVAVGAFVAYAARTTTGSPEFVVPWANLGDHGRSPCRCSRWPWRRCSRRRGCRSSGGLRRRERSLDAAAAGGADLDLPDRRLGLHAIDQGAGAGERLAAVRRRGGDDHRRLGQRDGAGAVLDRHRTEAVAFGLLGGDRLELGDGHLRVGLVVELVDLARDPLEQHDAAGPRVADGVGKGAEVERVAGHAHVADRPGPTAHRRHQRDLVARPHGRVGRRVLAVHRHHALARAQRADRRGRHRGEHVGDAGAVGQLDLEAVGAGALTQAGEESD